MYEARFISYQTPKGQELYFAKQDFPFAGRLNVGDTGIVDLSGFISSEKTTTGGVIKKVKITSASLINSGRLK